MNTKHTPGPWEWDGSVWNYDSENEAPWLVQSGSDHRVFVLLGSIKANKEADARLIAAAPELLEALQMLVADFGDYPASERPCLAFDKARAAIAKATGASHVSQQ